MNPDYVAFSATIDPAALTRLGIEWGHTLDDKVVMMRRDWVRAVRAGAVKDEMGRTPYRQRGVNPAMLSTP